MKNIAFYIAHPSQFFVFKSTIERLKNDHKIFIYIKSKDILEDVLKHHEIHFYNISVNPWKNNFLGNAINFFSRTSKLLSLFRKDKIDLLLTCASYSCQASFLLGIPSIVLNDDDYKVIRKSVVFGWPFSSIILAPKSCSMGFWKRKTFFYSGYQKLGYLHPNGFIPNNIVLEKYNLKDKNYFLIRMVSLTAHHDNGIKGINLKLLEKIISELNTFGQILISSEIELPEKMKKYQLKIDHRDIHHLIYFSKLLIGDSQSMAHEAALLGTPSIRINDFKDKIGVLNELEYTYGLTFSFLPQHSNEILLKINSLMKEDKSVFFKRRDKMLENKIDLSKLLIWLCADFKKNRKMLVNRLTDSMNELFL
jgi:predicted glycosyltransferase